MLPAALSAILLAILASLSFLVVRRTVHRLTQSPNTSTSTLPYSQIALLRPSELMDISGLLNESFRVNYHLVGLLMAVMSLYVVMYFVQRRRTAALSKPKCETEQRKAVGEEDLFQDVASLASRSSGFDELEWMREVSPHKGRLSGPSDSGERSRTEELYTCLSRHSSSSRQSNGHETQLRRSGSSGQELSSVFSCSPSPVASSPAPSITSKTDNKFGDLLTACHQTAPMTFSNLFDQIEADYFTKIGEGTHSDIFRVYSYRGDSVLKVVNLEYIIKFWDQLFSEIVIALKLSGLRQGVDNYTTGYTELRSVSCIWDGYTEELIKACQKFREEDNDNDEKISTDTLKANQPYLVWHMSYAGQPLHKVELEGVLQLWSILQQVTLCLAVAEEAFEFEHRDLSLRHILVKKTDEETEQFCMSGRSIVINTWGIKAHVIDFASSRITDGNNVVFTNLGHILEAPAEHNLMFVYKQMSSVVRGCWEGFHPMTNLLFVLHVTKELYRIYKPRFKNLTDPYESLAWSEIGSRRNQLMDYLCLADFVVNNFKPEPLN